MKAYSVTDKDEMCKLIIFAQSAGKAKYIASAYENIEFIDLRAVRRPTFDDLYKEGRIVMDWNSEPNRTTLIMHSNYRLLRVKKTAKWGGKK